MTHELTCKGCGTRLIFTDVAEGNYLKCPNCGHMTLMALEARAMSAPVQVDNSNTGGALDSLIAGMAGIILSFSCVCLVPLMLVANVVGLYVGIRSRGSLKTFAIVSNLVAILLELLVGWWYLA